MDKRLNSLFIHFAENPIKVVHAIQHAVINTTPCIRYRPGWQSSLFLFPLSMIPAWITDILVDKIRIGRNVTPAGVYKQIKE